MPDGRWRSRPLSPALASEPLALVARFICSTMLRATGSAVAWSSTELIEGNIHECTVATTSTANSSVSR